MLCFLILAVFLQTFTIIHTKADNSLGSRYAVCVDRHWATHCRAHSWRGACDSTASRTPWVALSATDRLRRRTDPRTILMAQTEVSGRRCHQWGAQAVARNPEQFRWREQKGCVAQPARSVKREHVSPRVYAAPTVRDVPVGPEPES